MLYRVPTAGGALRARFVVPVCLPEYGDQHVLEKGDVGLGDAVVRTRCSFRRSYAPPGLIGRFLAFANAHIKEARGVLTARSSPHLESWLARCPFVRDSLGGKKNDSGSVAYPGLVLCVKGSSPAARDVLDSLTAEVKRLLEDQSARVPWPMLCGV